ncbi:MAG: hypothetical protein ACK55H_05925 [Cyanobacteriota bacterium]
MNGSIQELDLDQLEDINGGFIGLLALAAFDVAIWAYNYKQAKKIEI